MPRPWTLSLAALVALGQLFSTVVAQAVSEPPAYTNTPQTILLSSLGGSLSSVQSSVITSIPTSSREAQVHTIKAGAGGFSFTPQQTQVPPGDIVTFEFYPPDHSVWQAEYGSACVPYSYADKDHEGKGFWFPTQWVSTPADATHFNITINDTQPIFFYCGAPGSCVDKFMVGAINPNSTQTLNGQVQAAKDADFQLVLGETVPNEATSTLRNGPTGAASNNNSSGGGGSHLSSGVIAGIVVGAVAFLVICAALFFFVGRSKSLKEVIKRQDANARVSGSHMGAASPGMSFSPTPGYAEAGHLPPYAQHNATETHPSGWASPNPQHMSMISQTNGMSQEQLDYYKHAQVQQAPVEMPSPQPGQNEFGAAELDGSSGQKAAGKP